MQGIKHVFFDLDRTLWDFEVNSEATLRELFSEFDLESKLGVGDDVFIAEYRKINELFWNDYRNGVITKSELRYARFEAAMKFFGYENRKLSAEIGEQYIYRSPQKTALVNGSISVLDYLKDKYDLHIITNGFEEVQHIKMKSSGLDRYFDKVITSEAAGAKKPSKVIYDYAEKITGAVAKESVMIGDDFEPDVIGALEAGWNAIFYNPTGIASEKEAYMEIERLADLKKLL